MVTLVDVNTPTNSETPKNITLGGNIRPTSHILRWCLLKCIDNKYTEKSIHSYQIHVTGSPPYANYDRLFSLNDNDIDYLIKSICQRSATIFLKGHKLTFVTVMVFNKMRLSIATKSGEKFLRLGSFAQSAVKSCNHPSFKWLREPASINAERVGHFHHIYTRIRWRRLFWYQVQIVGLVDGMWRLVLQMYEDFTFCFAQEPGRSKQSREQ